MHKAGYLAILCLSLLTYLTTVTSAGVTNPDISVIGQIISGHIDDPASENANAATLNLGETELVFDAYLNPYAKGFFVFTVGDAGLGTEEAYIAIFKGLPGTLNLKGGKYRVGFGKLNPLHPHAYPFIEGPRVLSAMLPGGKDGFNDAGAQGSVLLPSFGSWASNLSLDVLNGSSFHPDQIKASAAWVGRWSNSLLINDEVPLELGVSATQGANNVQWKTKSNVYGADIKTRIPFSALTNLTLQGEYFYNNSDVIVDTTTGSFNVPGRQGFYAFADLKFWQRCNAGVIYDQYQPPENKDFTNRAIKFFAGYALLEETTLFRLAYEQFMPEGSPVVHTYTFQVLFSMGPHKPHQF
jgi:hypothetical protein